MKTKLQPKSYNNYVNNEWVNSAKTRQVINPFNGETMAVVVDWKIRSVPFPPALAEAGAGWNESSPQLSGATRTSSAA